MQANHVHITWSGAHNKGMCQVQMCMPSDTHCAGLCTFAMTAQGEDASEEDDGEELLAAEPTLSAPASAEVRSGTCLAV